MPNRFVLILRPVKPFTIAFTVYVALLAACGRSKDAPQPAPGSAPAHAATPDARPPEPPIPDEATTKALADKACPRVTAPFFYRIEKDGKVSHLLGTRHISVPLSKLPSVVKTELGKAKLVVFETAGDDDVALPAADKPLPAQLGPALWKKLEALVGVENADAMREAQPSAVLISMMMMYEDVSATLDAELERAANEADIKTVGLETAAFQGQLLNELLDLRMLKAVLGGTTDRGMLRDESAEDIAEFCTGTEGAPGIDEDTRKQMIDAGYTAAEVAAINERLLFARNDNWMPKLDELFAEGDVFVAVGADHLSGPRGVVAGLTARGFTATRVK